MAKKDYTTRPRRGNGPQRLPLTGAVVRVVVPTAKDLTPRQRQRAVAAELGGLDLDAYAQSLARSEQSRVDGRRAGESDGALALRSRHRDALAFAREMVLSLEALRPLAEHLGMLDLSDPDGHELTLVLAALEAAKAEYMQVRTPAVARIGAVRSALDHAQSWARQRRERPPVTDEHGITFGTPDVDPDVIREEAMRVAPDLARIPVADWLRAIELWPGSATKHTRGGVRLRAPHAWTWPIVQERASKMGGDWSEVVFALLAPHGLTKSADPTALRKVWERESDSERTR